MNISTPSPPACPPPPANSRSNSGNNRAKRCEDDAIQLVCKQILKYRLFRGFYEERRYVEAVCAYRDIVKLHRAERDFEKTLLDIKKKLQLFYCQSTNYWIGITNELLIDACEQPDGLDTCIWAELEDIAFGEYWFSVKSIRFRDCEIIIKLKVVRAVAEDLIEEIMPVRKKRNSSRPTAVSCRSNVERPEKAIQTSELSAVESIQTDCTETKIVWQDFVGIAQSWGDSIKKSAYDFMAHDISKENIKSSLRFFGLLMVSLICSTIVAVKFLGIFTLRFMFELSRLTHALTPILLKCIDVFQKIVGGFYILLTMIWKDAVTNRRQQSKPLFDYRPLQYTRPVPKSIGFNINHSPRDIEFKQYADM